MYFTVEEENLIGMYHKSDRRRTAGTIQAVLPEVNEDMAALAFLWTRAPPLRRKLNPTGLYEPCVRRIFREPALLGAYQSIRF